MGPNQIWLVSLQEEDIKTDAEREDRAKTERRWLIHRPAREASEEINPADTLISDF